MFSQELAECRERLAELSVHCVTKAEFEEKVSAYEDLQAKSAAQKERVGKLVERNETMRLEVNLSRLQCIHASVPHNVIWLLFIFLLVVYFCCRLNS